MNAFDMVLESTTVLVEDGMFVLELNWDIEPGEGYGLRCTSDDPQLWREGTSSDLNYPYEVGDLLTITNSTAGPSLGLLLLLLRVGGRSPSPLSVCPTELGVTVTVAGTSDIQGARGIDSNGQVTPNPCGHRLRSIDLARPELAGTVHECDGCNQGRAVHSGALGRVHSQLIGRQVGMLCVPSTITASQTSALVMRMSA